jgi:hypothetical protein
MRWAWMTDKRPTFRQTSTRTTGNDPVDGIDPGGTRSTAMGRRKPDTPQTVEHAVKSGDRNVWRESRSAQPTPKDDKSRT